MECECEGIITFWIYVQSRLWGARMPFKFRKTPRRIDRWEMDDEYPAREFIDYKTSMITD